MEFKAIEALYICISCRGPCNDGAQGLRPQCPTRAASAPCLVPPDEECAKSLAKRTLANLYNERPTWRDLAHKKLDAAVFAAYAWPIGRQR